MASANPTITLRLATHDDVPTMTSIQVGAFEHTELSQRSFPSSEPEVWAYWADWIESKIDVLDTHMVVALISPSDLPAGPDSSSPAPPSTCSPVIVGWARWVRVAGTLGAPETSSKVFSTDVYPSCGDGAAAAHFFQTAHNARRRVMSAATSHWFLSMIVTYPHAQRKGVGSALMQYGVERADEDGWVCYLNASEDGKPLYERFGFRSAEQTSFDDLGQVMYHMKREATANGA
ncbi:acyl-CoA N-acyltransferase [Mariannaea sp. PMI_226]|nr:acyl-CoA N-acyltransferase [Mariannaea sp. PMI_226]